MHKLKIKRVYEQVEESDGFRILIDRIWPRGISKDAACLEEWAKHAAAGLADNSASYCFLKFSKFSSL